MKLWTLLLLAGISASAQTYQWSKSGGTVNNISETYGLEKIRDLTIDSQGNLYFITNVSSLGLTIDGNWKTLWSTNGTTTDGLLASFACDGTYRWSKVIGSGEFDEITGMGVDAQDNVYITCELPPVAYYPTAPDYVHFDTDTIMPISTYEENTHKEKLFMAKYSPSGELLWLKMPQPDDLSLIYSYTQYASREVIVEPNGELYWAVYLPAGPVEDGAYVATEGGVHILHYDADGNFIDGFRMDATFVSTPGRRFKMKRSPTTGNFYIAGKMPFDDGSVTIGDTEVTGVLYVAAFDAQGNALWVRSNESEVPFGYDLSDIDLDADDNVYFTSAARRMSLTNLEMDRFHGQQFESSTSTFAFLIKLNQQGDIVWMTNSTGPTAHGSCVKVMGDEVWVGMATKEVTWQGLYYTYFDLLVSGHHPVIAKFNKSTGTILSFQDMISSGGYDTPTAFARDANGSYYIGGQFTGWVTGGDTVYSTGGQTDFFLTKYGNADCDFLSVDTPHATAFRLWPNPAGDVLHLGNEEPVEVEIFGVTGVRVAALALQPNATVDVSHLPKGLYLLKTSKGDVVKFVKE